MTNTELEILTEQVDILKEAITDIAESTNCDRGYRAIVASNIVLAIRLKEIADILKPHPIGLTGPR